MYVFFVASNISRALFRVLNNLSMQYFLKY